MTTKNRPPADQQGATQSTAQSTNADGTTVDSGVPAYGSPDWHVLPLDDPRREVAAILHDAACWRRLCESPYIAEVLAEWIEWDTRRRHREASWAVSQGAREMAARGWRWLSYTELKRRRRLTSILPCDRCGAPVQMAHPFLDEDWNPPPIQCGRCAGAVAA